MTSPAAVAQGGTTIEPRLEPYIIGVAQVTVIGMASAAPGVSVGLTLAALAAFPHDLSRSAGPGGSPAAHGGGPGGGPVPPRSGTSPRIPGYPGPRPVSAPGQPAAPGGAAVPDAPGVTGGGAGEPRAADLTLARVADAAVSRVTVISCDPGSARAGGARSMPGARGCLHELIALARAAAPASKRHAASVVTRVTGPPRPPLPGRRALITILAPGGPGSGRVA